MPFYLNTVFGFVSTQTIADFTAGKKPARGAIDLRRAKPFDTFNEANELGAVLTESLHWPREARYYAIVYPAPMSIPEKNYAPR